MKRFAFLLLTMAAVLSGAAYGQEYSDWSAPVNLGSAINTAAFEQSAAISADGLSLYFQSNRPGGFGRYDLYVSQRASVNDPWGSPQNLGPNINTAEQEQGAMLSHDGHRLYFNSGRPGGFGQRDIYVARRHNKRDDFGWQPPQNLGSGVNTPFEELAACVYEDETTGKTFLYFNSNRPGGLGGHDIYVSELQPDETFGPPVLVQELSSPWEDTQVTIRRDGLELIFSSNRPGGVGYDDLWVATRESTLDPWSEPVNLGPVVNSGVIDGAPQLSFDGTALYFDSSPPPRIPGGALLDLWVSTRTKLTGPGQD